MKKKQKVLIIYTGGTIGMINDPLSGELSNVNFDLIFDHVPELNRLNIEIDSVSFQQPLDSSEMNAEHWKFLSKTIFDNYVQYDGFVVLHGTDTMAYTASALSFMFDGLQKPIVFTGSQLPIGMIRTDGKENLITAIEIAAQKGNDGLPLVREVTIYFDYKLFRGNRCTKDSAENFEAFRSPNYPELATAGVHLNYNRAQLFNTHHKELKYASALNTRVALVKFFPGMDFSLYRNLIRRSEIDGLVIETFGAGNAPKSGVLKEMLHDFISDGGIVLNISQCNSGSVIQGLYETSSMFNDLGVLSGQDITTEAAITKMMVLLTHDDPAWIKKQLSENIRGELTLLNKN